MCSQVTQSFFCIYSGDSSVVTIQGTVANQVGGGLLCVIRSGDDSIQHQPGGPLSAAAPCAAHAFTQEYALL